MISVCDFTQQPYNVLTFLYNMIVLVNRKGGLKPNSQVSLSKEQRKLKILKYNFKTVLYNCYLQFHTYIRLVKFISCNIALNSFKVNFPEVIKLSCHFGVLVNNEAISDIFLPNFENYQFTNDLTVQNIFHKFERNDIKICQRSCQSSEIEKMVQSNWYHPNIFSKMRQRNRTGPIRQL